MEEIETSKEPGNSNPEERENLSLPDKETIPHKSEGYVAVLRLLKEIAPNCAGPLDLEIRLKKLAKKTGLTVTALREEYRNLCSTPETEARGEAEEPEYADDHRRFALGWQQQAILFPRFELLLDRLDRVSSPDSSKRLLLIVGLLLLNREQVIGFWGSSSEGKTSAAELLLKLVDVKGWLRKCMRCYDMSQEALKYLGGPDGRGLVGRILFLDEMNPAEDGRDDRRQQLLRQTINEDCTEVTFEIVDRDDRGVLCARTLRLAKPFYVVFTTITPPHRWDEQFRSRAIFNETRLTPEQVTKAKERIAEPQVADETKLGLLHGFNLFLHELKRQDPRDPEEFYSVEVPFLKKLVKHDPEATGMELRRFKLIKSLIQSSAILHQNHRESDFDKYGRKILIATIEDYVNVKDVAALLVPVTTKPAGQRYMQTFRKIGFLLYSSPGKTKKELAVATGIRLRRLDTDLRDLEDIDFINSAYEKSSRAKHYSLCKQFQMLVSSVRIYDENAETDFWGILDPYVNAYEKEEDALDDTDLHKEQDIENSAET